MGGHTPGPWKADKVLNGNMVVGTADNSESIAEVWIDRESQRADAALIAAAPDLLEALRDMLATHSSGPDLENTPFKWLDARKRAVDAIAKAEGRES